MLFDPKPKEDRKDLYGRDEELNRLIEAMNSATPIILLLGVRRIGKTSLLKTALKELGQPYVYLDLRILEEEGYSKAILYNMLSKEVSRVVSRWRSLLDFLRKVKGVRIAGFHIEFDWRDRELALSSIFRSIDEWARRTEEAKYVIVAFDEAQLLRNMVGGKGKIDFRSLLAFCYDNLSYIKFVLTGSEVGLLTDFIGLEDPKSPLYGRVMEEIVVERFDNNKSLGFLKKGFEEIGMDVSNEILMEAVEKLDGIVGWLTYFGYVSSRKGRVSRDVLREAVDRAKELVRDELGKILVRSKLYRLILRTLALDINRWSQVKKAIEAWLGRQVTNAQVSRALRTLMKMGIIEKGENGYYIVDPIVKALAKEL